MTKGLLIVKDHSQEAHLTLEELCVICHLSENDLHVYIEHAIVQPKSSQEMTFTLSEMQRLQKALRLEKDLSINHEGTAVILNLLEELEELRAQLRIFERHY